MPSLAETQALLRLAVVNGQFAAAAPFVREASRLEIHRRHFESSLVGALRSRFPATVWLIGGQRFVEAACGFVRDRPPSSPCIAEYGRTFPPYVSRRSWAADLPYLESFAELDQTLGEVAIAIDTVRRVRSAWPIDTLMAHFLGDNAPSRLVFAPEDVELEIRGGRGSFEIARVESAHGMDVEEGA